MTTGMQLSIASAIGGAVFALLWGHWIEAAWALMAAFWMWQHTRLKDQYDDLRTGRATLPHEYRVTVRPETFQHVMEIINSQTPPPSPDHYSVGGTTPHLCVCGKPIKEHR